MNRKDVEAKLAAAETRRRQALARAEESRARLAEIENERAALLGETKIAERGVADFDAHLEQLRQELAEVELAEARDAVQHATRLRDAALARGAEAAGGLMVAIQEIADARSELAASQGRLLAIDHQAPRLASAEPTLMDDRWRALAPMVEAELGMRLESELVEAAVRSPNTLVVDRLPEHLRELARQRRRDLHRRSFNHRGNDDVQSTADIYEKS